MNFLIVGIVGIDFLHFFCLFSFLGGCDNEANRCDGYAAELSAATGKDCAYGNSTPAKRQKYFYEASTFYSLVAPPMLPQIRNCLQNVQDMEGVSLAQKSTLGELLSSVSQNPEISKGMAGSISRVAEKINDAVQKEKTKEADKERELKEIRDRRLNAVKKTISFNDSKTGQKKDKKIQFNAMSTAAGTTTATAGETKHNSSNNSNNSSSSITVAPSSVDTTTRDTTTPVTSSSTGNSPVRNSKASKTSNTNVLDPQALKKIKKQKQAEKARKKQEEEEEKRLIAKKEQELKRIKKSEQAAIQKETIRKKREKKDKEDNERIRKDQEEQVKKTCAKTGWSHF